MADLFDRVPRARAKPPDMPPADAPLADRMRPRTLEEFAGQEHLLGGKAGLTGEGKFLAAALQAARPPSMILWGPPGSGKTTLAFLIARATNCHFVFFSAVLAGVKEVREIIKVAKQQRQMEGAASRGTILFVDEIHRFNRSQQDAFLPQVEDGTVILMGATTENPSFELNAPLLSRCKVIVLRPLGISDITVLLQRALVDPERGLGKLGVQSAPELLALIADWAEGDARRALNLLESAVALCPDRSGLRTLTESIVREAAQERVLVFDKDREEHYNVISAFIKSMRGSDPDAAVYWLARMLEAGEDPLFIARRMIIFAAEDIGNADPQALTVAVSALQAFEAVGLAEGWIPLSQAAIYLASAPKSNASYRAYRRAKAELSSSGTLPVPLHLRNAPTRLMEREGYGEGYRYPHDEPGHIAAQDYLPAQLKGRRFYEPSDQGQEQQVRERFRQWRTELERRAKQTGPTPPIER